ncbi:MAG: hypothetical protein L3J45_06815 [Flavobacteriaceae bacterium]|nr:hypothetical protein [Flavobacteriaceae bacterium]
MKVYFKLLFLLLTVLPLKAQNILSKANQIISATQIAPKSERSLATVIGYNAQGIQVILRKGTGNFVCLANNPKNKSFSVACYHKDLEPMMARGRALKKEGKTHKEIEDIRTSEAKSGLLKVPSHPSTLYVLYGNKAKFNTNTKKIEHGHIRYVVYIPWASAKSTGLPLSPQVPGGPWLMFPETYKAHIMITPPTN